MLTTGLGLPTRYRLVLRGIEVLENRGEVVVLADIYLALRAPGIVARCGSLNPVAVLKIVVKPDGTVQASQYDSHGFISLSKGRYAVACVNDEVFLFGRLGDLRRRSQKFGPGPDLEPATESDRDALTQLVGVKSLDRIRPLEWDELSSRFDESLKKSGWRRLDSAWGYLPGVESTDNQFTLRTERTDAVHMIVAESTSADRPWSRILVKVDTRPWLSYKYPYSRPPALAP